MKQKKFMDISRIKEDTELTESNTNGFEVGDHIVIQEKIDGSNAAIAYDSDTGKLVAFSRKQELNELNTLNGFYNWVQTLNSDEFKEYPNYVFFGEWLCLSGDTVIRKTSGGKNSTYMTLREMYNFLNAPTPDKYHYNKKNGHLCILYGIKEGNVKEKDLISHYKQFNNVEDKYVLRVIKTCLNKKYIIFENDEYNLTEFGIHHMEDIKVKNNWWHRNGMPSIFSLYQDEDVVKANKIKNIVYTGNKEVYEVTTRKGLKIKSTLNHPFLTSNGFVQLKDLKEKDCVAITFMNNTRYGRSYGNGTKKIQERQNKYKEKIGSCEKCGLDSCLELHHKDRNHKNNVESNWEILCSSCHRKEHSKDNFFKGFIYDYEFDYIASIEYVGVEDCYDIEMEGDENNANFVANGFIVHNCKHKVKYIQDAYKKFYFYDVYDKENQKYLLQSEVKRLSDELGFIYVNTFYNGRFISWEHCKLFMNKSNIAIDKPEGIVCKNQTKINNPNSRKPFVLKIVNKDFAETMKKKEKVLDPEVEAAKLKAKEIVDQIVTRNRVEKMIYKLRDEGALPKKLNPEDMGMIARILPKEIYEDCIKEENEMVIAAGEYFGKMCSSTTMLHARNIILGEM